LHEAYMTVSGFPHNLCFTGHVPIYGIALYAPTCAVLQFSMGIYG